MDKKNSFSIDPASKTDSLAATQGNRPTQLLSLNLENKLSFFILGLVWLLLSLVLWLPILNSPWLEIKKNSLEPSTTTINNSIGEYIANIFYSLFGLSAWWCSVFLLVILINHPYLLKIFSHKQRPSYSRFLSMLGLMVLLCASPLAEVSIPSLAVGHHLPLGPGGLVGNTLGTMLTTLLATPVTQRIAVILVILGLLLIIQVSWLFIIKDLGYKLYNYFKPTEEDFLNEAEKNSLLAQGILQTPLPSLQLARSSRLLQKNLSNAPSVMNKKNVSFSEEKSSPQTEMKSAPPISVLRQAFSRRLPDRKLIEKELRKEADIIVSVFEENRVAIRLLEACQGPAFIRYHLKLNLPIEASEIKNAYQQLKRVFYNRPLFLNQLNPTLSNYELLIARNFVEKISLLQILQHSIFTNSHLFLLTALGKDTLNENVFLSLRQRTNLIVASKKPQEIQSAFRTLLFPLVFKYSLQNLQLILIEHENNFFNDIKELPHLITPVIRTLDSALSALAWVIAEITRRLQIFQQIGCTTIEELNDKILQGHKKGILVPDPFSENLDDPQPLRPFPYLVIMVDELEWLSRNENVNSLLLQLVSQGHSTGIHLLAGQSYFSIHRLDPAIKTFFSARLSFQLENKLDSRYLLGQEGAESLLAFPDALLALNDSHRPLRFQLALCNSTDYRHLIRNFKLKPKFNHSILHYTPQTLPNEKNDDLYDLAVQYVLTHKKTSISFLQRKMKIGYNLANELLVRMEKQGILSKGDLGGKREILDNTRP
ncbi:MAG: DNA translocase FtsK 4TM domain-containing protein [Neisseriaceae bacterium]